MAPGAEEVTLMPGPSRSSTPPRAMTRRRCQKALAGGSPAAAPWSLCRTAGSVIADLAGLPPLSHTAAAQSCSLDGPRPRKGQCPHIPCSQRGPFLNPMQVDSIQGRTGRLCPGHSHSHTAQVTCNRAAGACAHGDTLHTFAHFVNLSHDRPLPCATSGCGASCPSHSSRAPAPLWATATTQLGHTGHPLFGQSTEAGSTWQDTAG